MLETLLEKQLQYLRQSKSFRQYTNTLSAAVDILNKKNILSISGLRYTGKTELVAQIIQKTQNEEAFFYFNPQLDTLWSIKNHKDLMFLMDYMIRTRWKIRIVVLEDCSSIDGIKSFIRDLYESQNFKVIILWNNIKVEGVEEIELFPHTLKWAKTEDMYYGWLPHVRIIPDISYKKILLEAFLSDILEKEVSIPYRLKNLENFRKMLAYLASHNTPVSVRELHRLLWELDIHISHITLIEYINIALTTRILIKQEVYDLKKNAPIHTQSYYHFWDLWLRGIIWSFDILHYNNILTLEYISRWYQIYAGKYGSFNFDILAVKWDTRVWICVSDSADKIEVRKLARKLSKVPDLTERALLVLQKESLGIRKYNESWVPLSSLAEILETL